MDNFDLKKYLTEGRILKEALSNQDIKTLNDFIDISQKIRNKKDIDHKKEASNTGERVVFGKYDIEDFEGNEEVFNATSDILTKNKVIDPIEKKDGETIWDNFFKTEKDSDGNIIIKMGYNPSKNNPKIDLDDLDLDFGDDDVEIDLGEDPEDTDAEFKRLFPDLDL